MDLVIRPATQSDRDTVQALLTAQLVEHRLPAAADDVARGVACALAPGSTAWLWLATRGGRAVGVLLANELVSVEHGGLALWIEELYVTPEARRSGVARSLLERVFEHARSRAIRCVDLEVVPAQTAAIELYRKLRFADVNRYRLSLSLQ